MRRKKECDRENEWRKEKFRREKEWEKKNVTEAMNDKKRLW